MLKRNLYKLIFLFVCIATFAQKGTRVGYMDMNVILENISEYNKANDLLDKNIEKWKKEIELKKIQLRQYEEQLKKSKSLEMNFQVPQIESLYRFIEIAIHYT